MSYLDGTDMTCDQKIEFIETLLGIMQHVADMAFDDAPLPFGMSNPSED
ncbi:MAG: hypothetical protein AAFW60_07010 [Pseudomonadota bacterium]